MRKLFLSLGILLLGLTLLVFSSAEADPGYPEPPNLNSMVDFGLRLNGSVKTDEATGLATLSFMATGLGFAPPGITTAPFNDIRITVYPSGPVLDAWIDAAGNRQRISPDADGKLVLVKDTLDSMERSPTIGVTVPWDGQPMTVTAELTWIFHRYYSGTPYYEVYGGWVNERGETVRKDTMRITLPADLDILRVIGVGNRMDDVATTRRVDKLETRIAALEAKVVALEATGR